MIISRSNFTNDLLLGGQHHTLVLTNDNNCQVLGRKDYGRLGVGKVDEDVKILTEIPALNDKRIEQISCGDCSSFAVTDKGTVYAWGMGSNNQLGLGSEDDAFEPVLLTGAQVKDKRVMSANGGGQHTMFLVSKEATETAAAAKTTTAAAAKATTAATAKTAAAKETKKMNAGAATAEKTNKLTKMNGGETEIEREVGAGSDMVPEKKKVSKKK